ncbi:MAG: hypothetical protein M3P43_17135 [Actinomycetota bacterium]|nr:hypothetical protein [Actinomycetota bacterium]
MSGAGGLPSTKTCVYCAETVQAAAVRCRFCGQPLPTELLSISQRGKRYAAGATTTPRTFGVWDLSAGGPPIGTFAEDQDGWAKAWSFYTRMEGSAPAKTNEMSGQMIGGAVLAGIGAIVMAVGAFLPSRGSGEPEHLLLPCVEHIAEPS